jgi:hypothetical protein
LDIRTVFDELLLSIGNVEIALGTAVKDVSGLVPAIFGEGLFVELRFIPITREYVWSFQEKLARLVIFMSLE